MAPPLNFIARQTIWAIEHDHEILFLPRATKNLSALLNLDFSTYSIHRIQAWLNKQRSLRLSVGRQVFDKDKDIDTLMLLSFYVAEWIARTTRGVPLWTTLDGGGSVVNFPEDRHRSLGMLALPGVVQYVWVEESGDLMESIRLLINLKVLERPDEPLPPAPASRDCSYQERLKALPEPRHQEVFNAMPSGAVPPEMQSYFGEQVDILAQGHFVRAGVVQANSALYDPVYIGQCLAEVVFDPNNYLQYDDLKYLGDRLSQLKYLPDEEVLPAEAAAIRRYLKREDACLLSADISVGFFGYPLKLSSLWVEQAHLPDGMLSYAGVPLVIAPKLSRHIKLLPQALWSPAFVAQWRKEGEARLGLSYDVADLMRQAQQATRHQAVRLLLQEAQQPTVVNPSRGPQLPRRSPKSVIYQEDVPREGRGGLSLKFVLIGLTVMIVCMALMMGLSK